MGVSILLTFSKQDTLDSIFRGATQQVLSLPQNRERWLNNYTRAVVENNRKKKATSVKRELKTIYSALDNLNLQPKPDNGIHTSLNPRHASYNLYRPVES